MNSRAFGEIIRSERMKRGITQAELAKKAVLQEKLSAIGKTDTKAFHLKMLINLQILLVLK